MDCAPDGSVRMVSVVNIITCRPDPGSPGAVLHCWEVICWPDELVCWTLVARSNKAETAVPNRSGDSDGIGFDRVAYFSGGALGFVSNGTRDFAELALRVGEATRSSVLRLLPLAG